MLLIPHYLCLLCLFNFVVVMAVENSNPLKGRHVIMGLLPFPVSLDLIRNSSGYITNVEGIAYPGMVWLAQRLQFTYSYLQVNETKMEGQSGNLTYYLKHGKCDMIPGTVSMLISRIGDMDFTSGYLYGSGVFILQKPNSFTNFASITMPFQPLVWISIFVSMLAVIIALYLCKDLNPVWFRKLTGKYEIPSLKKNFSWIENITYVFGILVSQGQFCRKPSLKFQVVAAVWCLGTFVLVSAYNCRLTSYIMRPNIQPLVDSENDVANNPRVFPVVDKGTGLDVLYLNADNGLYKKMDDKLRLRPTTRCNTPRDCVELIKSGPYAYVKVMQAALKVMRDDFLVTKQCNLMLAKKRQYVPSSAWAFAKLNPYEKSIRLGLAEMFEYGLVEIWTRRYQPDVRLRSAYTNSVN